MKVEKRVIGHLEKCYCVAPLRYQGKSHFIAAAEKDHACYLYDTEGNYEETIWEQPGGVMSMVQIPGTDGQFLTTRKFYSPNDAESARIDLVIPEGNHQWRTKTLMQLPFLHRFGLLERSGHVYLIACALKSGHAYKDDWSMPGAVYGGELSELLSMQAAEPAKLQLLKGDMLKNHGYTEYRDHGVMTAVISCDSGVYQFIPPDAPGQSWEIRQLTDTAASDAVLVDMDGDGEPELAVMAPFHGEHFRIYKKIDGQYQVIFEETEPMPFLHAIYGGAFNGTSTVIVGHRKDKRNLVAYTYDHVRKEYKRQLIDEDCGAANVLKIQDRSGRDVLAAANREIDEIAYYRITDI